MNHHIKNFEPAGSASLTLAAIIIPTAVGAYAVVNLSGIPFALACLGAVIAFMCMVGTSSIPNERAHAAYREYLRTQPVEALARAANSPDKPEYTKLLIRQHLDTSHAGWHACLVCPGQASINV